MSAGLQAPGQDLDAPLEPLRMLADPLADDTIARVLGPWDHIAEAAAGHDPNWDMLALVNQQIAQWQSNGALSGWKAGADVPPHVARALEAYVRQGMQLPAWADPARIERAEELFMDYGMLSCTLLFCSSLPECYVIPDLSAVLHVAGQLEAHTEYRIRSTAAMIFPVMMIGGLTRPDGGGLSQVLKVRLIHATIRHLILRGNPSVATRADQIPALQDPGGTTSMHHALFARGWDIRNDGVPCSQDELAYTLLTFSYIFLRSMRKLGLRLPQADEEAYLHAWNVMGHVLGMERTLMADTMEQAEALFKRLQERGRANPYLPDARPALGQALMHTMEAVLPLRILRPFPVLLTRYLCGKRTVQDIGVDRCVPLPSTILFFGLMGLARGVDWLGRRVFPEFSLCRMITRVVGYQFTVRVLMDQTRPLKLPPGLLNQVSSMTHSWEVDPKAPKWVNRIEQRLTGRGAGKASQEASA